MRRFFRWVVGVPTAVFVIGFAIANRRIVVLSLDPFTQMDPSVSIPMPLWLLFFAGIFLGMIVGWVAAWWAQGKHRKAARESRNEVGRLQLELAEARKESVQEQPAQDVVPFNGGFL